MYERRTCQQFQFWIKKTIGETCALDWGSCWLGRAGTGLVAKVAVYFRAQQRWHLVSLIPGTGSQPSNHPTIFAQSLCFPIFSLASLVAGKIANLWTKLPPTLGNTLAPSKWPPQQLPHSPASLLSLSGPDLWSEEDLLDEDPCLQETVGFLYQNFEDKKISHAISGLSRLLRVGSFGWPLMRPGEIERVL